MIYIAEAHSIDEWYIGESAGEILNSHKTINDRQDCINKFIEKNDIKFPVYPDDMDDTFLTTFSSWPVRCYITLENKIKYISSPKNGEVDFCEIFEVAKSL